MRNLLKISPLFLTFCFISVCYASEVRLIYFYERGCKWCAYMDDVLNDPSIQNILKRNTDIVKVNIHGSVITEGKLTETELAKKYSIKAVPTLIFLDTSSEELLRVPGALTKEDFRSLICDNLKNLYNC